RVGLVAAAGVMLRRGATIRDRANEAIPNEQHDLAGEPAEGVDAGIDERRAARWNEALPELVEQGADDHEKHRQERPARVPAWKPPPTPRDECQPPEDEKLGEVRRLADPPVGRAKARWGD